MRAWRNVSVIANLIVMIHSATCVENDIRADDTAGVNHNASADHAAPSNRHVWGDDSSRMAGSGELLSLCFEFLERTMSSPIVANRHNHRLVGNLGQSCQCAHNRQTNQDLPGQQRIIIQITNGPRGITLFVSTQQNIGYNLSMATTTDDNHAHVLRMAPHEFLRGSLSRLIDAFALEYFPCGQSDNFQVQP